MSRGRNFYPEEVNFVLPDTDNGTPPSVLVTQRLADELFPGEDALGKPIYWGSMEISTIVGIIDHMHGSWVSWDNLDNVVIQPGKPAFINNRYIARVEPGMRDTIMPLIEQKLGESNLLRVVKNASNTFVLASGSMPGPLS